jgi:O-antigen/teichoic acid export membrane protein
MWLERRTSLTEPKATSQPAAQSTKARSTGLGKLGRHSVVYGVGIALDKMVAFIMLPIYTRFLTPTDYGLLQLVSMTLEIASIVAGSRLANGVFRYYHKAEDPQEKKRVLTTALLLMVSLYFLTGTVVWLISGPISGFVFKDVAHADLIQIGAASFAFQSLLIVPFSYLQLVQGSTTFVVLNALKLLLQVAFNVLFIVFMSMGAKGVLLSGLIANVVIGLILAVILFRSTGIGFSRGAARDLLRYGLPMVGTQVAGFVLTLGDRYFLQNSGNAAMVGLYGLAYQFGFLLTTVGLTPFQTAWDPMRFAVAKRPDRDAVYSRVFVYFNILLLTAALGIALFVKDVLVIMADEAFRSAASIVPVILIAYVLYSWTKVLDLGILMSERTEFVTLANWIGAGVALAGYLYLIPRYFAFGAAWATVIAFAARHLLIYVSAQRLWHVRYRWQPVLRIMVLVGVVYAISLGIHTQHVVTSLVLRTGLVAVYGVGLWFSGVLSDSDRRIVLDAIRSPRRVLLRKTG